MARIRMIKPEFFDDPDVADLSMAARLCFIGLWTQADRAGLLTDNPRRLKVRLFPYDAVDIVPLFDELAAKSMITRYTVDGEAYLSIPNFKKHQRPHPKEPESVLPAPAVERNGEPCKKTASPSESGVLILESGVLSSEDGTRKAAASPRPRPVENPNDNLSIVTKLAHEAIDIEGMNADLGQLADAVKSLCAIRGIAYNSEVVRKAVDSALAQRRRSA